MICLLCLQNGKTTLLLYLNLPQAYVFSLLYVVSRCNTGSIDQSADKNKLSLMLVVVCDMAHSRFRESRIHCHPGEGKS